MMTVSLESSNQIVKTPRTIQARSCLLWNTLKWHNSISREWNVYEWIWLNCKPIPHNLPIKKNEEMRLICARTNWTKYEISGSSGYFAIFDLQTQLTNATFDFQLHKWKPKVEKWLARASAKTNLKNKSIFLCHVSFLAFFSFWHHIFGVVYIVPTCSHLQHNFRVARSKPVPLTTPTLPAWSYHVSGASITVR